MRSLLVLIHATVPLLTLSVWSGLPGQADNDVFQLAELPPLPAVVEDVEDESEQPVDLAEATEPDVDPTPAEADQTVWFKTNRRISLVALAESLDLDPETFALLNELSVGTILQAQSWFAVPGSHRAAASDLISVLSSSERDSPPMDPPPPIGDVAAIQQGDSLQTFLSRHGITSKQLRSFNPGVEITALTVGRELRIAKATSGQSLLAIRPGVSGGASWPDLPGFLPTDQPGFGGKHYSWPTKGVFTSGYGWRWGRMHKGIDIANNTGTPILASRDGIVAFAGWSGAYGYLVEITHGDGESTRYAHNSRILVKKGQIIPRGARISLMGSTGRSTGPHLHFEIRRSGGAAMNPLQKLPPRKA